MSAILTLLSAIEPQHWLVAGLLLLIAEMLTGTSYLLWPAVAAFITALAAFLGLGGVAGVSLMATLPAKLRGARSPSRSGRERC